MKIAYILKKGLQCYPPCLAQVLFLKDLGVELVVYHGKNSPYIDKLLEERNIENYTFDSDKENNDNFHSYLNFFTYTAEAKKVLSTLPEDTIVWYGNCESAMTLGKCVRNHRFVLTVLELYEPGSMYDKLVKSIIPYAEQVICCEKHRAVIMKDRYSLPSIPHVIPNKPYMIENTAKPEKPEVDALLKMYSGKKFVLYQGLVQPDRPIDNVALALKKINDPELVLAVMGKADAVVESKIRECYSNTLFLGYIPAPEHLNITKLAYIGIAIYDDSNLNNQFCAPNKIYEYSAFKIPMITSLNLGLTETVGAYGAGECVDFKDVDNIVQAISNIKNNYKAYSSNAFKFYNAADCRASIKKIIDELAVDK